MPIELDAEQLAYIKKHHIDPREAVDFPCSPAFSSLYAGQGLTRDYSPEYYQNQQAEDTQRQANELSHRINVLEQQRLSGPATKQEVFELKHLVNKLTERVSRKKREDGY